jgi:hypothetical protein
MKFSMTGQEKDDLLTQSKQVTAHRGDHMDRFDCTIIMIYLGEYYIKKNQRAYML